MFFARSEPRPVRLAGATADVLLRRLHRGPGDETQSEVVFPPGWERPDAGCFDVAEEVVWLEGGMTMSGTTHGAGCYCYLPAGYPRVASRSASGARALAWFSDAPTWVPIPSDVHEDQENLEDQGDPGDPGDPVIICPIDAAPQIQGPLPDTTGRLLRDGRDGRRTWLLDGLPGGGVLPVGCLLVPLSCLGALPVPPGAPLPRLDGPLLLRTGTP